MKSLTAPELEKIIFLDKCGVPYDEIIDVINGDREADEEKRDNHIDYYVWCILEEATLE
jgi:hypothetical protein